MSDRRERCHQAMTRLVTRGRQAVLGAFEESRAQAGYRQAFEVEARAPVRQALELEALVEAVSEAEVLLMGAYHTAPEVPRALARLVARLPAAPGGEILVVPFAGPDTEDALARFGAGELDPDELVEELDDEHPWPFDRAAYRPLLEVAAGRGMRLVPHGKTGKGAAPMARARADAARIQAALERAPAARVVVVVGELHLARGHLPACLGEALGKDPETWPRLVHSADEAFLELERTGDAPAAARLTSGLLAAFAAAPYRLYESFQSWRHDAPELPFPLRDPWRTADEPDLQGLLERVAGRMQENLEVDLASLGPRPWGALVTPEHLDELAGLPLEEDALDEVLSQLAEGRGYFLPELPAVVLAGAGAGAAAEEIAHAWNFALTGPPPGGLAPEDDLRARILREAVGFYGSLGLVPDRPSWHPDEGEDAPAGTRMARLQAMVRRGLEVGMDLPADEVRRLYQEDLEDYLGLAHLAGYLLGGAWPRTPEVAAEVLALTPGGDDATRAAAWKHAWDLARAE